MIETIPIYDDLYNHFNLFDDKVYYYKLNLTF